MRNLFLIVGAVVSAFAAQPAEAHNGTFIRSACTGGVEAEASMCVGYVTGVAQTLYLANKWAAKSMPSQFCPPADFDPDEAAAIVLEYMDANPTNAYMDDGSVLTLAAFTDKWPC